MIANEACANPSLCTNVREHAGHGGEVLVVAPVPNVPIRDEVCDDDARRRAERRLARSVATLAELGLHPRGEIGDADPVRALQDALVSFAADEVIIATHPDERSNWPAGGVVDAAHVQFHLPVTHIVVDVGTPMHSGTSG